MVLPPSSNHFQPIHSRTPSAEVKDISANMFKLPPQIPLTQNFPNLTPTNLSNNSAASFFDQKNGSSLTNIFAPPNTATVQQNTNNLSAENKIQNVSLPTLPIHAPIPTKPPSQFPGLTTSNPNVSTSNANPQFSSLIAPPVSLPPPISMPPPPSTNLTSGTTGANPYAAKGALNKKVYDTGIPVVTLAPPNSLPNSMPKPPEIETSPSNFPNVPPPLTTGSLPNNVHHSPLMGGINNTAAPFMPGPGPANTYMPLAPPMQQTIDSFQQLPTMPHTPLNNFQIQNPG